MDEVRQRDHVLNPGRYVGAQDIEDSLEPFHEKLERLVETLGQQMKQGTRLDAAITANLKDLSA
jgi:type I restriction enzyme M protein